MPRYVTVGNLTIDHVVLADGQRFAKQCGGACLYAAVGIYLWGHDVGIVSVKGRDFPDAWMEAMVAAGLDIRGIKRTPRPHGMRALMIYEPDGSRTAAPAEPVPADLSPQEAEAQQVDLWYDFSPRAADIPLAYLCARGVHVAPMPTERQAECVRAMHGHARLITVDPPWWPGTQPQGQFVDLSLVSAVLPSEAEVEGHFGPVSPQEGAQRLESLGARIVAVKLGAQGSIVYQPDTGRWWKVPAFPSQVKDPTGAGDAYCGGFLVGLDETGDPLQAALYGTVSASFIVEGFGALDPLQFTRAKAEARLARLRSTVAHGILPSDPVPF